MTGLAELRVKESDRLARDRRGSERLRGAGRGRRATSLVVHGCGGPPPGVRQIEARHDHRIAMSFLVLGGLALAPVTRERRGDDRDQLSRVRGADEPARRAHRAGRAVSGAARRIVAVDGPAASGKTTLAHRLAVAFRPGLPGYRPALPRGRLAAAARAGKPLHRRRKRGRGGARGDARPTSTRPALRNDAAQPGRLGGRSRSRKCARRCSACSGSFGSRRPRRGAGGPRHRHRGAPRCEPQDLRHRECRRTRAAAVQGVAGPRRADYI